MHRMLIPTLAALLVAIPATVAAQETAHERSTFALHMEPRVVAAHPGGEAVLRVVVESLVDQTVTLASGAGHLRASSVDVAAGHANGTMLKLRHPDDAPPRVIVSVRGIGQDGEAHEAQAIVETRRAPPPTAGLRVMLEPGDARGEMRIVLHSRAERAVQLALEGLPEGWTATVEPADLKVGPGAAGRAILRIASPDGNATKPTGHAVLIVTSGDERKEIALHAKVGEHRPCAPRENASEHRCPPPMHRPHRDGGEDATRSKGDAPRSQMDAILQRLLRIEAALRALGVRLGGEAEA